MVYSKRNILKAEINNLSQQIGLLSKAIDIAEKDGNVYTIAEKTENIYLAEPKAVQLSDEEKFRLAAKCVNIFLEDRFSELEQYLSPFLKSYPP